MNESPRATGAELTASDDEAKAFNKGKGRVLAAMIGSLIAAVAAFAWYLTQDQVEPYAELGKQINGLKTQYFDGFLVCALPGARLAELKNDAALREQFHGRGRAGARYGAHLRDRCAPPLRELATRLRALQPPAESAPLVSAMGAGATKMRVGVDGYAAHLDILTGAYDQAAAEPELEPLIRGWYEFRKAHADFNHLVREKLGR